MKMAGRIPPCFLAGDASAGCRDLAGDERHVEDSFGGRLMAEL
jgi:hypothetical protein